LSAPGVFPPINVFRAENGRGGARRFEHDRITARLVNGVPEVRVPKAERAKPRRIPVGS